MSLFSDLYNEEVGIFSPERGATGKDAGGGVNYYAVEGVEVEGNGHGTRF
jgi:hypothetical protein